jgi:hypothetical protein
LQNAVLFTEGLVIGLGVQVGEIFSIITIPLISGPPPLTFGHPSHPCLEASEAVKSSIVPKSGAQVAFVLWANRIPVEGGHCFDCSFTFAPVFFVRTMTITAIIIVLEKWDTAVLVEGMTTGKFSSGLHIERLLTDSTYTVLHNFVGIDGTEDFCAIPVNVRLVPIDTPEMIREFFHIKSSLIGVSLCSSLSL